MPPAVERTGKTDAEYLFGTEEDWLHGDGSTRARRQLAERIAKRVVRNNQAAQSKARLLDLEEILSNPGALEQPDAVAPRLAWFGRVTLLAGREKSGGKSTLLTAAAAAVTQPRRTQFLGEDVIPGEVLWVSSDQEHASDIARRAVRFGAHPAWFHVMWPGDHPFEELQHVAGWLEPILIVVDSLANFAIDVEDSHSADAWPKVLLPLIELARKGHAIVVVHHATKSTGQYRDSTAIGANVDAILQVQPVADHDSWRRIEGKGRWEIDDFTVDLDGDGYRLVSGTEVAADSKQGKARQELHAALGEQELTAKEVAARLGISKSTAERRLKADPLVTHRLDEQTHLYRVTLSPPVSPHTAAPLHGACGDAVVDPGRVTASNRVNDVVTRLEGDDDLPF